MEFLLFGYWGTPISSYLIVYFGLGAIGFLAAYFHRYLLALIIPIIVWFSISDYQVSIDIMSGRTILMYFS